MLTEYLEHGPSHESGQDKPRHVTGLELVVLSILLVRLLRALHLTAHGASVLARSLWRAGQRARLRFARWRDRRWRRPRHTLSCDIAALEPGICPVCLAPLAGRACGEDDEEAAEGDEEQAVEGALPAAGAIYRLRCGHAFHAACLEGWLDRQWTCPLCRGDVGDVREWVELRESGDAASAAAARRPGGGDGTLAETLLGGAAPALSETLLAGVARQAEVELPEAAVGAGSEGGSCDYRAAALA